MINTFESVKVLNVSKVASLDTDFSPASKKGFHIFIAPGDNASHEAGEVVIIKAKPVKNEQATEVPIVLGDWNPVLLESISANANVDTDIDLDNYSVYYSEISDY